MKSRGFTLVELLVVIAIIAIVVAVAAPDFRATIDSTRVRKTSDYLVQLINTARSEALRRNKTVYFEIVSGSFCLGTTSPCTGDIRSDPILGEVTVTPSVPSLEFDNIRGLPPSTGATFTVTGSSVTRTVSVNMLGIVKVSGS